MASTSQTTPDTPVTLKVNYDGTTRRTKLPLRDLGASSLEDKLRSFLNIPSTANCVFERYSDSAASYVVLDQNNISVYKQLYRAAKAKQKLKLRVTVKEVEEKGPKPVTIEDEEDPELPEPVQTKSPAPLISEASSVISAPADEQAHLRTRLRSAVELLAQEHKEMERNIELLEASFAAQRLSPPQPEPEVKKTSEIPITFGPCSRGWRSTATTAETPVCAPRANFAVCCNSCDRTIPESHYHCSTCDDGDFDLCQECVDQGITCYGADHWLIKRFVKNGMIINSTTERIAPKPKAMPQEERRVPEHPFQLPAPPVVQHAILHMNHVPFNAVRTCNNCVQEFAEQEFVHCTVCEDFDLCKSCFTKDQHGHHPKHGFVPAVEGTAFSADISKRLAPGRSQRHNAICDGCDKFIFGVRHKCLDCPDWDYCSDCVVNAGFIHPNHRFVPIYEQIADVRARTNFRPTHFGICCDGPLCSSGRNTAAYIVGDRYKCAVCNDTDFCANCEASPANTHNKTHPLIKFKTPVRHVSVTTTGEHEDGQRMPAMGDRSLRTRTSTSSRATETTLNNQDIAPAPVQTVVDMAPVKVEESATELAKVEVKEEPVEEESKPEESIVEESASADDLIAVFERDTIADGTVMPPNHVFEQTWVLRNAGTVPWPAGCAVKFVGGDYMGHVDPKHPAGIQELVSASESTVCYNTLAPGQEFPFTVLLRTPAREGKTISYWRLTTKDGLKFGHRLWCEVDVKKPEEETKEIIKEEPQQTIAPIVEESVSSSPKTEESQMIFPKLEKESPVSSVHEEAKSETYVPYEADQEANDFDEYVEDDDWAEEAEESEDGFMTDEEYDILDASDEEYLEEQQKKLLKK